MRDANIEELKTTEGGWWWIPEPSPWPRPIPRPPWDDPWHPCGGYCYPIDPVL
jgi:hypothetical protein